MAGVFLRDRVDQTFIRNESDDETGTDLKTVTKRPRLL